MARSGVINLGPLAAAIARFKPPPNQIRGLDAADWMGPLQPVAPLAPAGVEPRGFQYPPGQNLIYTPRAREALTAERLRALSLYPLARIAIENVKDQVVAKDWKVRLRRRPGETTRSRLARESGDQTLLRLYKLIESPNPEEDFRDWLRPMLDDAMVIDAPVALVRRTAAGAVAELRHIDGATICRYVDENAFTPAPPSPAYAQLWYGTPSVDLTSEQLVYRPRNVLSYKLYGMSPTEQIAPLLEVGFDRLRFRAAYYGDGSVPGAIMLVPPGVGSDKVREAQDWLDSDLAGNLAKRRQLRLIQGFSEQGKDQILFPKEPLLKDEYDDYEISQVCFAYGASRQRLVRQLSRGSAKQSQDAAEEEGLEPWLDWVTGVVNRILRMAAGGSEYEFVFAGFRETDVVKQSQADASDIKNGIRTINEIREDRGYEPRPEPEAGQLGIVTPTGFVLLGEAPNGGSTAGNPAGGAPRPDVHEGASAGAGNASASRPAEPAKAAGAGKAAADARARAQIETASEAIGRWLRNAAATVSGTISGGVPRGTSKADGHDARRDAEDLLAIVANLAWQRVSGALEPVLYSQFLAGAQSAGASADDSEVAAAQYASERSAEMASGAADAHWSVNAATQRAVEELVKRGEEQGWSDAEFVAAVEADPAFGSERGRTIAENEAHMAFEAGKVAAWAARPVPPKKQWMLSPAHLLLDECDDNASVGAVALGEVFPSGARNPPSHPNCRCSLQEVQAI